MPGLVCEIWHDEATCSFETSLICPENDRLRKAMTPNAKLVHTYTAQSDFEVFRKSNDWHGWGPWHSPADIAERFFNENEAEEQRRYIVTRDMR
jgi:hypothetical protein